MISNIFKRNEKLLFLLLLIIIIITIITSLFIGSEKINVLNAFRSVLNNEINSDVKILFKLRFPRIFAAFITGSILASCGLVFQTLLKNPLAEPFTLGISSGASFGAGLSIFISDFFLSHRLSIFPFAFAGAMISIALILTFSLRKQSGLFLIIFLGITLSFFFQAGLTLMLTILGNRSMEVILWTFGTFTATPSWDILFIYTLTAAVVWIILLLNHKELDIFYLSEELIKTSGINYYLLRSLLFFSVSFITALSVSFFGVIGFIGLIVPHLVKLIFRNNHLSLITGSILTGGIILLISDDIARSIVSLITDSGREIPVGVITSLIGSPFFLFFLLRRR